MTHPGSAVPVGEALARLHRLPPHPALARVTRQEDAGSLDQPCRTLAFLLPDLADEVGHLRDAVTTALTRAPEQQVGIHGDFSADQVLLTADGRAIHDLDDAVVGDPARDLGTLAAQLERRVLRGELTDGARAAAVDALLGGYARHADPPAGQAPQTAAALLRLAPHAFRTRAPGWRLEAEALVHGAAALLAAPR